MDVTKPYEFIGFGAMDVTKPYEFIGFGAVEKVLGDAFPDRDRDPLCNVQGFQNGASLTIVVPREFDVIAARQVTDAELNAFVRQFLQAPEIPDMCL